MKKAAMALIFFFLVFLSFTTYASESVPLQKDILLEESIYGPQDLPQEITFTLYNSQDALTPIGSQTFTRGQYTVDFEFSQSDGVTAGKVARIKAEFTNTLKLKDNFGEPIKPKELWAAVEVADVEVGTRTKVSNETLVRLLLNSDASLATYLTLAYEGDENPITTIYKDLPMSFADSDGAKISLSEHFSSIVAGTTGLDGVKTSVDPPYWEKSGDNIFYNNGKVGIGTDNPKMELDLRGKLNIASNQPQLFLEDTSGDTGSWSINNYNGHLNFDNPTIGYANRKVTFKSNGRVGIGTTSPAYELAVNGTIRCKQLIVDTGWSDFVFRDDYKLPPLSEVDQFIKQKGHLPGIPSEAEVKEKGVNVGDISSKLLQKIEELTLYVIDLKKENDILKEKIANIEKAVQ